MYSIHTRLTEFNKNRLPQMLPLKYKAMAINVFCFYRGTCHLFYEDLAKAKDLPDSPLSWVCGDLHLENFGSFKGDDTEEYFDLNDFDEAMLAPAAWEVARLITSIFIAFGSLGLKKAEALKAAKLFLNAYSTTLTHGKAKSIDPRTAGGMVCEFLKKVQKRKQKELLKKCCQKQNGRLELLIDNERHFELEPALKEELTGFLDGMINTIHCLPYQYKVQDCNFRIAGTGSIGVKRYLFLLRNQDEKKKYLLVGMKQAMSSALKPYLDVPQPQWPSEGERVAAIQKRMQNISPALLTPVIFKDEPYLLKQMQPMEDKINFEDLKEHYDEIDKVICDMAVLTASAQLRSSGREGSAIADDLVAYGENNQWVEGLLKYAQQYSAQVKADYKAFMKGYNNGDYNVF